MEAPIKTTESLKNKCPICGENLYTYWFTPCSDSPECGLWYIECNSLECKYEYEGNFGDLDELSQKFDIV